MSGRSTPISDWNPQVVSIEKVYKHPMADALSVVTTSIGDYPIITKLDEYQPGDLACYIPIDSIVPDTEQFHFLSPRKYIDMEGPQGPVKVPIGPKYEVGNVPEHNRIIKAKRLRGVYSQGLLMPIVPILNFPNPKGQVRGINVWSVGDSIVEAMNLLKWEEEEEDNLPNIPKAKGQTEKKPDGWTIPYYDIDGMRKFVDVIIPGEQIVLTEKLHGANGGFCHDGEKLWCKSRNFFKRGIITWKDDEDVEHSSESTDQWWDVARRFQLEEKLAEYPMLSFYGEVYGQVKGFRYDCEVVDGKLQTKIRFFDIWDIKRGLYLNYPDFLMICQELGLLLAPELYCGPWLGKEKMYPYAEGKTTLGGKHIREGFVLRTKIERYCERLQGRMQVKLVGEGYNLQK